MEDDEEEVPADIITLPGASGSVADATCCAAAKPLHDPTTSAIVPQARELPNIFIIVISWH